MSSVELKLKPGADAGSVKAKIQQLLGEGFRVQDRYEQQADTFRIMEIEKLISYIFLTFILMIACFNVIGSLSMLIIDKKADVVTLRNLGAGDKLITRIFLFEGRMISLIGAGVGGSAFFSSSRNSDCFRWEAATPAAILWWMPIRSVSMYGIL